MLPCAIWTGMRARLRLRKRTLPAACALFLRRGVSRLVPATVAQPCLWKEQHLSALCQSCTQ